MVKTVASYARVSTLGQEQHGHGLDAQRHALDTLIASHADWVHPPALAFEDTGSGANWQLPGLNAMMAAAKDGAFDLVVVPAFDRLARDLAKAVMIRRDLKNLGIGIVYATMPDLATSKNADFIENILASVAEEEKRTITARLVGGRVAKARKREVVGVGPAPYGYRYVREGPEDKRKVVGLEIDPATELTVREILGRLRTESTVAIARDLNQRGIPAPGYGQNVAKRWSYNTIRTIGTSLTYTGTLVFGKTQWDQGRRVESYEPVRVPVPAMITLAEHEAIVAAMKGRKRTRSARPRTIDGTPFRDEYTLRGALTCRNCNRPLKTAHNNGYRYYLCGGRCGLPAVRADAIETMAASVLRATLLDEAAVARAIDTWAHWSQKQAANWGQRNEKLGKEIAAEQRRLDAVIDQLIDAGTGAFAQRLRQRAHEIELVIARLEAAKTVPPPDAGAQMATISLDEIVESYTDDLALDFDTFAATELPRYVKQFQLRGTVTVGGPDDVKLGRLHRYAIEWTANIPLIIPSGQQILKPFQLRVTGEIAPLPMAAD